VDWSASNVPGPARPRPDAIWVGQSGPAGEPARETYFRTRDAAVQHVASTLERLVAAQHRVLVGFDFPYGYPSGLARSLGLAGPTPAWAQTWTELSRRIADDATNASNRFEVASDLNARIAPAAPGPFWGCPPNRGTSTLSPTGPGFPYRVDDVVVLGRLRLADARMSGVQEVWKLLGTGSVGSQALVGIPRVHWLRHHPSLQHVSRVWPFETGFTSNPAPAEGPFVLHAEIWPGIVNARLDQEIRETNAIRDQAQVRLMCRWAAELDREGQLGAQFDVPHGLTPAEIQQVVEEEAWILGETAARAQRAALRAAPSVRASGARQGGRRDPNSSVAPPPPSTPAPEPLPRKEGSMIEYTKPLPNITDRNRPFWDAARQGELRMQRCLACGHVRYPIGPVCTVCLSEDSEWARLSGRGTVFATLVYHQVYNPAYADDVPYNVSMIQLDEGPRLFSNVVGVPPDQVKVGDAVEVVFDAVTDEVSIPRFRPRAGS
jgi:uncharacterized OB-fold protein